MSEMKYAVMKLLQNVELDNPLTGKTESTKIAGIAGFIPVYDTMEEAEESAGDKYEIFPITEQLNR